MNLRVKFTKEGYLKYLSHLDMMRLFQRTFRRGNIPIAYSQGFNPQPKLSIANPLALGIESESEFMDIELNEKIPEDSFISIMNSELPKEIRIIDAKYVEHNNKVTSIIGWSYYEIKVSICDLESIELLEKSIDEWLANEEIIFERTKYKRGKKIKSKRNIRPLIGNINIKLDEKYDEKAKEYVLTINCLLKSGEGGNLKPTDLLKSMKENLCLNIDIEMADIKRLNMYIDKDGMIKLPM